LRQTKAIGSNDNDSVITKDILDAINNEYQIFMTQKGDEFDPLDVLIEHHHLSHKGFADCFIKGLTLLCLV